MSRQSPSTLPTEVVLSANSSGIARAAQLLCAGKLVILPTETVYGIALSLASAQSRQTARLMKTRVSENSVASPWVIHVAGPEELLAWAPHLSATGRRLVAKSLPGPVAYQVKLDARSEKGARDRLGDAADETLQEGYLTLRCPDFSATQDVLRAVDQPVAIIGAGTPAQPASYEVQDLSPELLVSSGSVPALVSAVMDGGPTRYRRSSTVVRLDGDRYSVVRQGVIDERILHRLADFTILFLCSGNTCRSPMAAAISAKLLADKLGISVSELHLRHVVVQSAGLHASRGMRAALEGMDAVKAFGADLSGHISQPATTDLLRRADVIYTMTGAHREEVLELLPGAERKTFVFDPEGDIPDPIGAPFPVYERVAQRLAMVLQERLSEWPV